MSNAVALIGYWSTDAPLTPNQTQADMAVLQQISVPEGVILESASVYVDGHLWHWHTEKVRSF